MNTIKNNNCLLYTSDAADDLLCVDLGGRRIIKKKRYLIFVFKCLNFKLFTPEITPMQELPYSVRVVLSFNTVSPAVASTDYIRGVFLSK